MYQCGVLYVMLVCCDEDRAFDMTKKRREVDDALCGMVLVMVCLCDCAKVGER